MLDFINSSLFLIRKRGKMIKNYALKHGWFYYYRLREDKVKAINGNFSSLRSFLENVGINCPNEYFNKGPRSSSLTFKIKGLKLHCLQGHEINALAREALKLANSRNAHTAIELFLLKNDDKTMAVEVPLWLETNEIAFFNELFKSKDPLTGHIDILRLENDKIWIWDYKPNSQQEIYASTQTFFYAYMLSKRTNIDLDNFRCGYFDSNYAYVFNPAKASIVKDNSLVNFI
ncbi:MAG: PD-(D/E)XK nuclease family protein [Nanoarchaeota archaeon]